MHTPPLTERQIQGLIARQPGPIEKRMVEQLWRELQSLRENEANTRMFHEIEVAY